MRPAAFVLFMCVSCAQVWAKDGMDCWGDNKKSATKRVAGFVLRVSPYHDKNEDEDLCRAVVQDANKKVVFFAKDQAFSIVLTGEDVNGDGVPDVVFEGYSGGAHCCWTYYIVSLGESPGLLYKFENERGSAFVHNRTTGRMEIVTMYGAFDYFDFLSHGETPFPDVYFRLDGKQLVDVSREHLGDYDIDIRKARKKLDVESLNKFQSVSYHNTLVSDRASRQTASKVLDIVFAFLYSGRISEAHKTIKEMWPSFDQERIWKLILETKHQGILSCARPARTPDTRPRRFAEH